MLSFIFFFFKQKTAYEMRISDWSSDVCSSDLPVHGLYRRLVLAQPGQDPAAARAAQLPPEALGLAQPAAHGRADRRRAGLDLYRSEEHTSELQSLMRISYAVFCLKKKNNKESHKKTH